MLIYHGLHNSHLYSINNDNFYTVLYATDDKMPNSEKWLKMKSEQRRTFLFLPLYTDSDTLR